MSPVQPNEFPPADLSGPPLYATADDLRDELDLDATALPDDDAWRLLEDACDEVDEMLGAWPVVRSPSPWAGRKVDLTWDLEDLQLDALRKATVKLARIQRVDPDDPALPARGTVSGPDFSYTVKDGSAGEPRLKKQARRVLANAGLIRTSARMTH